jgi:hypothetical protein
VCLVVEHEIDLSLRIVYEDLIFINYELKPEGPKITKILL